MERHPPKLSAPATLLDEAPGSDAADPSPRTVRLPRFVLDHEIGLGTVVSSLAGAVGLRPCGGCEARARRMNRWVAFSPNRR